MLQLITKFEKWNPNTFQREQYTALSNGVPLSPSTILTVAHVLSHRGAKRLRTSHEGREVTVLANDGDLALLSVDHGRTGCTVRHWHEVPLAEGSLVDHVYFEHHTRKVETRQIKWYEDQHSREGFAPGMSGSGLFIGGKLAGLAEWTNGFYFAQFEIDVFLESGGI